MANLATRSVVPVLTFLVVGTLPFLLALLLFSQGRLEWPWLLGLAGSSGLTLVTGIGLMLRHGNQLQKVLQEHGNQARRLQEAHLEIDRLDYEYQHASRLRRDLEREREEQNQAILQVAREFVSIAGTVQEKAEATDLDAVTQQQIRSLNRICNDQVELLTVSVDTPPEPEAFVADRAINQLVDRLRDRGVLPEQFRIECEDTDISTLAPRSWFLQTLEHSLSGMSWFAQAEPVTASMISFQHADLGNVLQVRIRSKGLGISASEGRHWFRQFAMHTDTDGRYLGPGLRMMLIKRYVDKLGGQVQLATEEQNALTLSVALPLRPEATPFLEE